MKNISNCCFKKFDLQIVVKYMQAYFIKTRAQETKNLGLWTYF